MMTNKKSARTEATVPDTNLKKQNKDTTLLNENQHYHVDFLEEYKADRRRNNQEISETAIEMLTVVSELLDGAYNKGYQDGTNAALNNLE